MATSGDGKTERKILLAVDGSKYADHAAEWYAQNIHRPGNTVVLVHIAEPVAGLQASDHMYGGMAMTKKEWEKTVTHFKAKEAAVRKKYVDLLGDHGVTNVEFVCKYGDPGDTLVKTAKEEHCTLIVIGTRGLGTIRRTVMGSVSDYVMHHAHVPVAIACKN